jgi:hypothetical protein
VTVSDDIGSGAATGPITFSFTFSEDVGSSFADADVTVSAGTKGPLAKANATLYRLVVTPPPNAAGNITVTVPVGAVMDLAGNVNTAAGSGTQAYDTVVALTQMELPVNFDSATVEYGLVGFGGADDSTVVVDPTDDTNKVAKVVKSATAETWAGTTVTAVDDSSPPVQLGFATKLPFDASNTRMTVRVWSPHTGIQVRLKAEDHANPGITVETEATFTAAANSWQTLEFDFANEAAGTAILDVAKSYDKVSIFFNFGVAGATAGEKTYYFDDLTWIGGGGTGGGGGPTPFAKVTFDDSAVTYTLTGFGGAEDSTVVVDPTDPANKVAKVVKSATAETWAGTTVSTGPAGSAGKIPFDASNTRMTVRVWSPDSGITVLLKVENAANGDIRSEVAATTTVAGNWETLQFDFASGTPALNPANTYDKVSIFFNFGTSGAAAGGAKTYYFDDVTFIGGTGGGGGGGGTFDTLTFESGAVTYTLTGFGGAEDSTVVVDPTDGANHVAKVVKSATAETWAGTTVSTGANSSIQTLPFSATKKKMTVRVWSPDSGIQVRLKVEDAGDPTRSCETEATVTTAAGWQALTFDFANPAAGTAALNLAYTFNKVSIFFNFGIGGAAAGGAKTYYFDDVAFVP